MDDHAKHGTRASPLLRGCGLHIPLISNLVNLADLEGGRLINAVSTLVMYIVHVVSLKPIHTSGFATPSRSSKTSLNKRDLPHGTSKNAFPSKTTSASDTAECKPYNAAPCIQYPSISPAPFEK